MILDIAYVLLLTPQGPAPWSRTPVRIRSQHLVLHPIGERLGPAVHYVGSFRAFEDCRRQPPKVQQRGQGVLISFEGEYHRATASDRDARPGRPWVGVGLQRPTPEEARKTAGKRSFLTGRLFSRVGRAPLKALYAEPAPHTRRRQAQLIRPRGFEGHRPTLSTHDGPWALGSRDSQSTVPSHLELDELGRLREHRERMAAVCFRQGDVQQPPRTLKDAYQRSWWDIFLDQAFIHLVEAWSTILAPIVFERC